MDFNFVLQEVGDFGLYQKLLCLFLVIPSASLCALVYFTQFFIILVPDHRCRLYDETNRDATFNISNISNPYEENDSILLNSQCEMYISSEYTEFSSNISVDFNKTSKCQHGWVYNFTELYPTIATEVCNYFLIS